MKLIVLQLIWLYSIDKKLHVCVSSVHLQPQKQPELRVQATNVGGPAVAMFCLMQKSHMGAVLGGESDVGRWERSLRILVSHTWIQGPKPELDKFSFGFIRL